MYRNTCAIILAAGKGKRLNSDKPKALHDLCGKPLIGYIIERCAAFNIPLHIVVGHQGEAVRDALGKNYTYTYQPEQWGTGHAVLCALPAVPSHITTAAVFNCDDSAFYRAETIERMLQTHAENKPNITMITVLQDNPTGLGRIIRNSEGRVIGIREERLASSYEKMINEVNTGAYVFDMNFLRIFLPLVERNITGEYFITDLISLAAKTEKGIAALTLKNSEEYVSINTKEQLEKACSLMTERLVGERCQAPFVLR